MISFVVISWSFYCLWCFGLALLFTPQHTKYFGGVATQFKQTGFFASYTNSEHFVHRTSWFFLFIFFQLSLQLR